MIVFFDLQEHFFFFPSKIVENSLFSVSNFFLWIEFSKWISFHEIKNHYFNKYKSEMESEATKRQKCK